MRYDFECQACGHELEVQQSIKEYKVLKKCPKCKKNKLSRVYIAPYLAIMKEPETVGHLAYRNTKKMGKYELDEKEIARKERKQTAQEEMSKLPGTKVKKKGTTPWWRPGTDKPDKTLSTMTDEQKKKYIATGEKS